MLRSAPFWTALLIAGLLALDITRNDSAAILFLGRELFDLITWLAFWR